MRGAECVYVCGSVYQCAASNSRSHPKMRGESCRLSSLTPSLGTVSIHLPHGRSGGFGRERNRRGMRRGQRGEPRGEQETGRTWMKCAVCSTLTFVSLMARDGASQRAGGILDGVCGLSETGAVRDSVRRCQRCLRVGGRHEGGSASGRAREGVCVCARCALTHKKREGGGRLNTRKSALQAGMSSIRDASSSATIATPGFFCFWRQETTGRRTCGSGSGTVPCCCVFPD